VNKIKEFEKILLNRFFYSVGILALIRIGTFLPVPGIDHSELAFYIQRHSIAKNIISTFSGDNTFVLGLFTLNIFPFLNATIAIQLLLGFSPKLSKLQKEGDYEGRRTIVRLTRLLTVILAIIQSVGVALYLRQILFDWNIFLASEIVLWLTTGAMIVLWLSQLITDYGLGNGSSLLIYTNILANLPNLFKGLINQNNSNIFFSIAITITVFASLYGIIFLNKGLLKIPLISSKQLNQTALQDRANNYIPLRYNQAGVMPIILTTTMLVVPNYLISLEIFQSLTFLSAYKFLYWIGYFWLIVSFSSFYSSVVLKPKEMADQLQRMAVAIPGVRPGLQTNYYLKQLINRITFIGSIMLAVITVVPNFIESTFNITGLNGLSTTSLLIVAGVLLDLVREIENIYYSTVYSKNYD
jgi:preprotein translocase subunit SecY